MKPFIAFSFIIALTACAHTQPRLSGTGTQYQLWQTQVLEECARKAATITVEYARRQGYDLTRDKKYNFFYTDGRTEDAWGMYHQAHVRGREFILNRKVA